MTRDDFMPVHWTGTIYDPITRYHWTSNTIRGYSRDPPTLLLQDFPNHSKSQSRRRLIDLNATLVELHDDDDHHHESFLSPHELLDTRHPSRLERQIEALEQVWSEQESQQGTLASIGVFAFLCPRVPDEADDDLTHERPSSSIAEQCLRLRIRACAQSKRRSGPTSRDYLHHVLLLAETYVRMSCWSQSQVHATRVQRELGATGHHDDHQHLASRVHLIFGQVALANQDWRAARVYLQRVARNNESLDPARKRACAHALGQALVGLAHCQEAQVQAQVEAEARTWMRSMAGLAAVRDRASALIFSNHHHHDEFSSSPPHHDEFSSSRTTRTTATTTETLSRARRSEAYDRAKLELLEEKILNNSTSSKRCSVTSKQRLLAEAEEVLQEALTSALQQQPEARLEQAKSHVMLGHFYLLQRAWTKSIEAFEQAQARYAERNEHHVLLTLTFLRQHLSRLYATTGQRVKARASCKVVTTDLRRVILDLDTSTLVWRSQRIWHLTREALKTYDLWLTLMITTAKEEEEEEEEEEERRNIREQRVALARVGYGQGSLEYAAEVRSMGQQLMHNEKTTEEARTYVEIARDLYERHRGPRGSRVSEMNEWLKKIEDRKKGTSFMS